MKKALAVIASSIALLGAQTAVASETYLKPAATPPWVFTGTVNVNKGIALTCNVTLEISGPEDAADTSPAFSHTDLRHASATITLSGGFLGLCSSVIVSPIAAGDITYSGNASSGTFTLNNVFVTTITPGNCQGSISGTWTHGSPSTLGVSGTLPAVSGSPCTMNGTLTLDDPGDGSVSTPGDPGHDPHKNI